MKKLKLICIALLMCYATGAKTANNYDIKKINAQIDSINEVPLFKNEYKPFLKMMVDSTFNYLYKYIAYTYPTEPTTNHVEAAAYLTKICFNMECAFNINDWFNPNKLNFILWEFRQFWQKLSTDYPNNKNSKIIAAAYLCDNFTIAYTLCNVGNNNNNDNGGNVCDSVIIQPLSYTIDNNIDSIYNRDTFNIDPMFLPPYPNTRFNFDTTGRTITPYVVTGLGTGTAKYLNSPDDDVKHFSYIPLKDSTYNDTLVYIYRRPVHTAPPFYCHDDSTMNRLKPIIIHVIKRDTTPEECPFYGTPTLLLKTIQNSSGGTDLMVNFSLVNYTPQNGVYDFNILEYRLNVPNSNYPHEIVIPYAVTPTTRIITDNNKQTILAGLNSHATLTVIYTYTQNGTTGIEKSITFNLPIIPFNNSPFIQNIGDITGTCGVNATIR